VKHLAVAGLPLRGKGAAVAESGTADEARTASTFDLQLLAGDRRSGSSRPGQRDLADVLARITIIVLFTFMAVRIGADFLATGRLTGLLLLASETLVVVLTVFRRAPSAVDRSLRARLLTAISMMGPPLVRPAVVAALLSETITVALSAAGLLVVIGGKMSLGRSFGLMPANRGIVSTGLYRLVRHPIYLGYLITHVGFVAANPTIWNAITLVAADVALLIRATCEEKTLAKDPEYRAYQERVRWRVVPGLF
jgi:protein-S-isoprenylcysteine O-methyltransferase Ste14